MGRRRAGPSARRYVGWPRDPSCALEANEAAGRLCEARAIRWTSKLSLAGETGELTFRDCFCMTADRPTIMESDTPLSRQEKRFESRSAKTLATEAEVDGNGRLCLHAPLWIALNHLIGLPNPMS